MDLETSAKILSRALTAAVSLRSLFRSGVGIKKLVAKSKEEPKKEKPAKDNVKEKQLRGALLHMGYKAPEVDRTLKQLSGKIESNDLPDLVREAIGLLNNK